MDTGDKIREIRQEYKEYLTKKHPEWSENTVSTHVSDAFFIWNNTVIPGFWKVFVSDDSMEFARVAIRDFLKNETKSETYEERTRGYFRDLKRMKEFFDIVHGGVENRIGNEFKSEFDMLCLNIVTELKNKYPYIRRIYVRAEFPHIDDSYTEYILKRYDETYYPKQLINSGRAAYVERNYEMIDNSNYCVIYYDENYVPPKRKSSRDALNDYHPKSGTKLAYNYAVKKGLHILNIFINRIL